MKYLLASAPPPGVRNPSGEPELRKSTGKETSFFECHSGCREKWGIVAIGCYSACLLEEGLPSGSLFLVS